MHSTYNVDWVEIMDLIEVDISSNFPDRSLTDDWIESVDLFRIASISAAVAIAHYVYGNTSINKYK